MASGFFNDSWLYYSCFDLLQQGSACPSYEAVYACLNVWGIICIGNIYRQICMQYGMDWTVPNNCDVQHWLRVEYKSEMENSTSSLQCIKLFHDLLLLAERPDQHCNLLWSDVDPLPSIQVSRTEHENLTNSVFSCCFYCCNFWLGFCKERTSWRGFNCHDSGLQCFSDFCDTFCGLFLVQNERITVLKRGEASNLEETYHIYCRLRHTKQFLSSCFNLEYDEIVWNWWNGRMGRQIMQKYLRTVFPLAFPRTRISFAASEDVWACLFQDNLQQFLKAFQE